MSDKQDTSVDFRRAWRGFFIDLELAKHWQGVASLKSFGSPLSPNPILDQVIPTLFFLRLICLLDDALDNHIARERIPKGRGFREDLHHRIALLADHSLILKVDGLMQVKETRNRIAHEGAHASWHELDEAIDLVEGQLRALGYIDERPAFQWYAERSAMRETARSGAIGEWEYCYGLREADKQVVEVNWTELLMDDDA